LETSKNRDFSKVHGRSYFKNHHHKYEGLAA